MIEYSQKGHNNTYKEYILPFNLTLLISTFKEMSQIMIKLTNMKPMVVFLTIKF